jgi:copper homeostasis protein
VGGLTAAPADIAAALSGAGGPIFALVRRQAKTFRLKPDEVTALLSEVEELSSLGVDGVVVGVLDGSGRIDLPAMTDLVSAAGGLPVTFHRAYDEVEDPLRGVGLLVRAGVARVLTSGGARTAWEGRAVLRDLVRAAGAELAVLGGGGIRGDHVRELVDETGLREVHARASAIARIEEALA